MSQFKMIDVQVEEIDEPVQGDWWQVEDFWQLEEIDEKLKMIDRIEAISQPSS